MQFSEWLVLIVIAMPMAQLYFGRKNDEEDLTLREHLAANAPACPDWYEPAGLPLPKEPEAIGFSEEDLKQISDWRHDPCYDLPKGPLLDYQTQFETYLEDRLEVQNKNKVRRLALWAVHYADALEEQLAND